MAITGVVLGMEGPPVSATVAFSLSVIAIVSLFISSRSLAPITVSAAAGRIRLFKGESTVIPLEMGANSSRWTRRSSVSIQAAPWVESEVRHLTGDRVEIVVKPRLAGHFEGLAAVVDEVDALGLFEYRRDTKIDVVVESLPLALATRGELPETSFKSLEENPSGVAGMGQELFGVAEYQAGLDTGDILWKRAARASDDRLPMRVREGGTKGVVRVGITVGWPSVDEGRRAATVDKVAEAIGQLGKDLLTIGTTLEVLYPFEGEVRSLRASSLAELADIVTGAWTSSDGTVDAEEFVEKDVDAVVLESDDPEEVWYFAEACQVPLLLVSDKLTGTQLPPRVVALTGKKDLSGLAGKVLSG